MSAKKRRRRDGRNAASESASIAKKKSGVSARSTVSTRPRRGFTVAELVRRAPPQTAAQYAVRESAAEMRQRSKPSFAPKVATSRITRGVSFVEAKRNGISTEKQRRFVNMQLRLVRELDRPELRPKKQRELDEVIEQPRESKRLRREASKRLDERRAADGLPDRPKCKERPKDTRGNGGSRSYIPWCK